MGGSWSKIRTKFIKKDSKVKTDLLLEVCDLIDDRRRDYIIALGKIISLPSVFSLESHPEKIYDICSIIRKKLESFGTKVRFASIGKNLPIILGELKASKGSSKKSTVLIYGHLDVQATSFSNDLEAEPFRIAQKGRLLGSKNFSSDKESVLGWLHAIEALKYSLNDLPVNIKFIFNGMKELGPNGLESILKNLKESPFLKEIDYVCISDSYCLKKEKPCLGYGARGVVNFELSVGCASNDLHSGLFGGVMNEAMRDLIMLLDTLVDKSGRILIKGIYKDIAPVTGEELESYRNVEFDINEFKNNIGVRHLISGDDKIKVLMAMWRYPSLSFHGIEGAFSEPGTKNVIPKRAIGKFSIRIVPDLTVERTAELVEKYLRKELEKLNTPNNIDLQYEGSEPWVASTLSHNFKAGIKAISDVYGTVPDLVRYGESIPIVSILDKVINKSILLLPMATSENESYAQNEKIDSQKYIKGIKLFASYLYNLGQCVTELPS